MFAFFERVWRAFDDQDPGAGQTRSSPSSATAPARDAILASSSSAAATAARSTLSPVRPPAALTGHRCQDCTFINPGQCTSCRMCGAVARAHHGRSRDSLTGQGESTGSHASKIANSTATETKTKTKTKTTTSSYLTSGVAALQPSASSALLPVADAASSSSTPDVSCDRCTFNNPRNNTECSMCFARLSKRVYTQRSTTVSHGTGREPKDAGDGGGGYGSYDDSGRREWVDRKRTAQSTASAYKSARNGSVLQATRPNRASSQASSPSPRQSSGDDGCVVVVRNVADTADAGSTLQQIIEMCVGVKPMRVWNEGTASEFYVRLANEQEAQACLAHGVLSIKGKTAIFHKPEDKGSNQLDGAVLTDAASSASGSAKRSPRSSDGSCTRTNFSAGRKLHVSPTQISKAFELLECGLRELVHREMTRVYSAAWRSSAYLAAALPNVFAAAELDAQSLLLILQEFWAPVFEQACAGPWRGKVPACCRVLEQLYVAHCQPRPDSVEAKPQRETSVVKQTACATAMSVLLDSVQASGYAVDMLKHELASWVWKSARMR
eukprot:g47951.t1